MRSRVDPARGVVYDGLVVLPRPAELLSPTRQWYGLSRARSAGTHANLGAGELRNCLRSLRHGMLRELSREDETESRLDLPRGHRLLLVHLHELSSFAGNLVERVHYQGIHNAHRLLRHADLRVDLLQRAVDVGVEVQLRLLLLLAVSGLRSGSTLGRLHLRSHDYTSALP